MFCSCPPRVYTKLTSLISGVCAGMEGFRTALKVLLAAGAMAAAFLLIWFATEVLLVVFAGILF